MAITPAATSAPRMRPVCFRLRVRPELVPAYRERHAAVWPEMLQALAETGWHDYRIFVADDGTCIGTFTTRDLDASLAGMAARDINARWQAEMQPFFEGLDAPADRSFELIPLAFDLDAQLAALDPSPRS
ncbi:L-rhamnose mutarotase [Agrococcus jenensis]|uniref:L-rhamnose mutarotase n=1 Tax=Agrococcus jenensis TaxID=46353 RepID=A0A3N2ARP0_9MICO|nr:L-rhamnose mutarotase [Agrococcus jenensis]ROR65713.1 L-rhamnose mutarotase [Agrococcus jenensis]